MTGRERVVDPLLGTNKATRFPIPNEKVRGADQRFETNWRSKFKPGLVGRIDSIAASNGDGRALDDPKCSPSKEVGDNRYGSRTDGVDSHLNRIVLNRRRDVRDINPPCAELAEISIYPSVEAIECLEAIAHGEGSESFRIGKDGAKLREMSSPIVHETDVHDPPAPEVG